MEESSETHAHYGNWADSLGSIVDKTEQNLYGNVSRGRQPQGNNINATHSSHMCINDEVYPLTLENMYTRHTQLGLVENREREYLEEQFKKDVVKNIEILDKKVYKETDYCKDEIDNLKATVKLLSQRVNNSRTENEVFQRNSREFMHEKFNENDTRFKSYEDKVHIEIDQRLEEYETHMEKFTHGLKELKEIRNLIDPTIEEEIERIRKIYELKLENIVEKMERISRKAVENEKSLDEILNKYQVEIEAMKNDFLHTTELQNKRIHSTFDEQNDVLKSFDGDLNILERKFKTFQNDHITQTDDLTRSVNDMIIEVRKTIDKHNSKIDEQFDEWEVKRGRNEIELDAKIYEFSLASEKISKESIKNEKFKVSVREQSEKLDDKCDTLEKEVKELVGIVKLLDQERIQDGRISDDLQNKIKNLRSDVSNCITEINTINKNTDDLQEEFYNNVIINLDEFKHASVEDFNTINKRISNMVPLLEHIHEIDQEIDLLKTKQRPKIIYNRKDLKSPLTSVMQDIDIEEKRMHLSNSRERRRNYNSQGVDPNKYELHEEEEDEEHSRDISPVEEIMSKDKDSKRRFQKLKKYESAGLKSEQVLKNTQRSEVTVIKRKSVITPSDENSEITFQKEDSVVEDDLKVEEFSGFESSQREKRDFFKSSGRDRKDPHKGKSVILILGSAPIIQEPKVDSSIEESKGNNQTFNYVENFKVFCFLTP